MCMCVTFCVCVCVYVCVCMWVRMQAHMCTHTLMHMCVRSGTNALTVCNSCIIVVVEFTNKSKLQWAFLFKVCLSSNHVFRDTILTHMMSHSFHYIRLMLQYSHSSPGMFGTGSLLPFRRLDPPPPFLCHSSVPFEFYVIYIASHLFHVIVMPTFFHAPDRKATQLDKKQISGFAFHLIFHHFSLFNCCLSVVL